MKIQFNNEMKFKDLDVGDFFFCDGKIYVKIVEEEGYNAVGLTEISNEEPALHCLPDSFICCLLTGKIVIE